MSNSKVVYEGWMVRYGRRKIGRSFIHMRYFVLESRLLAYYKKKPQDNVVPTKTLLIDGNCRVEDRGLKTHHGHMVYVLSVYNKKEKYNRITMAAFNIQEALIWKEKIEYVIDQHQESQTTNGNKYVSFEYKSGVDSGRNASSSEHDSQFSAAEDEDESHHRSLLRTTIGNGPRESVFDWTKEFDSDLANQNSNNQAFSRKYWRLLQCQNGLRIFEELDEVDILPKSCSRAMKAVGVVEATCEEIFELIMSMDTTRCEWDCSFQYGSLVEEVDGHTAILYHRLQLDWFPTFVWPRDLCYVRYWRRNDDGSYVVLFRSREHENCGPQPGFVRAHIESGGYNISSLKPRNGRPRTQVQHLMQIDLKGWGVGYVSSFQQHCLLQMLNSVAGLREYYSQTDERPVAPRIPVMVNMTSVSSSSKRSKKLQSSSAHHRSPSLDQIHAANRNAVLMDEYSDEDEDLQADQEAMSSAVEVEDKRNGFEEESTEEIDLSIFSGNLRHDDHDKARNCWTVSNGNNFRVRSKRFCYDKSKIPAGKHLMDLVAVDWFKDTKRMDHVARRPGCAAQVASDRGHFSIIFNLQVPGSTHYSMVFYFVAKELVPGSLLQRFVDGDDEFRNSRLKLIPSVPKGSWIVRQSVGSTPCLLGKAVDCNYIRDPKYLEVGVDIGSSTVANGVLGLVIGVITTLVVDMVFLVHANITDELPERLRGAVRVSHIELSSAIVPVLESDPLDSLNYARKFGNVCSRYASFVRPQVGFLQDLYARRLDFLQKNGSRKVVAGATQSRQAKNERVELVSTSLRAKLGIPKHEEALFRAEDYNSLGCMGSLRTWNHNLCENLELSIVHHSPIGIQEIALCLDSATSETVGGKIHGECLNYTVNKFVYLGGAQSGQFPIWISVIIQPHMQIRNPIEFCKDIIIEQDDKKTACVMPALVLIRYMSHCQYAKRVEYFEAPTSNFLKGEQCPVSWYGYWKLCRVCSTSFLFGVLVAVKRMYVNGENFHHTKIAPWGQGSSAAGGYCHGQWSRKEGVEDRKLGLGAKEADSFRKEEIGLGLVKFANLGQD